MIQTAVGLSRQGVSVCMLEGEPSILFDSARVVKGFTLSGKRSLLGDAFGIRRLAHNMKSDCLVAFTDFFPETLVPTVLVAVITRRKLLVNVTSTAYKAEDGRRLLGLVRDRKTGDGIGPLLAFFAYHTSRRLAFRIGTCLVANHYMEVYSRSRLHARRVAIVGGGVEDFWYSRSGAAKEFDGVYVGRFDPSKRVPTLIRAWRRVVDKKADAKLLLVGESGTELPLVRRLVDELDLSSNVTFAGFINDRRELADRVRSAKLFAFPSVREGFGLVVAEAMAAGLPCVICDVEPLREVFGEAAILVRADEPGGFAEAILGLLLDERRRSEYSTRSVSLAQNFSWNTVAKNVLAAIDN